jgi:hypothetical protein
LPGECLSAWKRGWKAPFSLWRISTTIS